MADDLHKEAIDVLAKNRICRLFNNAEQERPLEREAVFDTEVRRRSREIVDFYRQSDAAVKAATDFLRKELS